MDEDIDHLPYEKWILEAFDVHQDHPLRKAILHILQDAARADSDDVCKPGITDSQRSFAAGRLATSKDLFAVINDIFTQANNRQDPPV